MRNELRELGYQVMSEIDHGEAFYSNEGLLDFISVLDRLKKVATDYTMNNIEDALEEEE